MFSIKCYMLSGTVFYYSSFFENANEAIDKIFEMEQSSVHKNDKMQLCQIKYDSLGNIQERIITEVLSE